MLKLNPGTNFPIVRKLGDPSDEGTNYVRAVVRNSTTGVTLATINLTDAGSRRFTGFFPVGSVEDWFFDVTTSVYTDSGYTTISTVYAEENETYHVQTTLSPQLQNVALQGMGVDINYKKIKQMIDESLKAQNWLKIEDFIRAVETSSNEVKAILTPILPAIKAIVIPEIFIPEQKEVDFGPLIEKIETLKSELSVISDKKIETDSIETILNNLILEVKSYISNHSIEMSKNMESISEKIESIITENNISKEEKLSKIKSAIAEIGEFDIPEKKKVDFKRAHLLIGKK